MNDAQEIRIADQSEQRAAAYAHLLWIASATGAAASDLRRAAEAGESLGRSADGFVEDLGLAASYREAVAVREQMADRLFAKLDAMEALDAARARCEAAHAEMLEMERRVGFARDSLDRAARAMVAAKRIDEQHPIYAREWRRAGAEPPPGTHRPRSLS